VGYFVLRLERGGLPVRIERWTIVLDGREH